MRSPDLDGVPLVALEAAAVPVALVGTLVVVSLGGLASTGVRLAGDRFDASATAVAVATGIVAVATVMVLAAAAGAAVEAYRRRFRRTGGGTQLLVGLFVPVLALLAAVAYAVAELGTLAPPWWLLGAAAAAAHATAFRAVAMYSTSRKHRRRGSVVAGVAALPATVAMAVLLTERFLAGSAADAGAQVADWLAAAGVPRVGLLVVVLPVGVAAAYGGFRARTAPAGSSSPSAGSRPRSPTLPEPSRVPDASLRGVAVSLREGWIGSLPGAGLVLGAGSSGETAAGSGSASGPQRPPVSARSSGSGAGGAGNRSGGDGSSGGDRSGRGSSADGGGTRRIGRSRSDAGSGGGSSGGSESSSGGSEGSSGGGSSGSGSSSGGRGSSGGSGSSGRSSGSSSGSTGGSNAGRGGGSDSSAPGGSSGSSGSGASDGGTSDDDGSGSDTRIFTGNFGSYGDEGDTVDRCPACEETIPSDGVYTFCPFCGQEL